MKHTKRPLNFAAPSFPKEGFATEGFAKDAFGHPEPEAPGLGMPPAPAGVGRAAASTGARDLAKRAEPSSAALTPSRVNSSFVYVLAGAATVLWVGGLSAYSLGLRSHMGPFEDDHFILLILALLGLAPVGLIWIGAFALRQGVRLLAEANRMQALSDKMVAPAALAAARTGSTVHAIRQEIDSAVMAAESAQQELLALRDMLSKESDRMIEMASGAAREATGLVQTLGRERQAFGVLSGQLETRVGDIGEAITRHARMVTEASDLAQTQIHEAEAALAARAADLAAAAGEASEAARMAGDDLARQAARVEQAGVTVGEQVRFMEDGLGQQRAALVTLAHAMRGDQEDLAVYFESQRAQLVETLRQSEQGAEKVGEAALKGADALRELISSAVDQLRDMSDQAQTERDLLGGAALQSLGAFSEAAAFERRALEEETRRAIHELSLSAEAAHKAAEAAGAAAREKVDQLNEAAFVVGQKADASFDARLNEARGLIERSAHLVDEAGARSAAKLEQGVNAAFQALDALQRSLSDIEDRAAQAPQDVMARGEEIRNALDSANETLMTGARAAARELEAIDNAFQERVKRNYEMLSEAVRLMGVLGGGATARAGGVPGVPPRPAPLQTAPLPLRHREAAPPPSDFASDHGEAETQTPDDITPDLGLRPRLKLTGLDEPAPPKPLAPAPTESDPDWTWNELVSALDENDADDAEIERVLIEEIQGLGIDATALIPRRRLQDLVQAYETLDAPAARDVIHRIAPAAVRKLARLVISDKLLRAQADRLINRYVGLIRGASRRGMEGPTVMTLLSSDAGRAFMLLDAAVSDLD
jgi:hypothetical protein